eukprot:scaffold8056_cov114-Isochrysis_galbana.AAC.2
MRWRRMSDPSVRAGGRSFPIVLFGFIEISVEFSKISESQTSRPRFGIVFFLDLVSVAAIFSDCAGGTLSAQPEPPLSSLRRVHALTTSVHKAWHRLHLSHLDLAGADWIYWRLATGRSRGGGGAGRG